MTFWFGVELALDFGLPLLLAVVGVWIVWREWPRGKRKGVIVCRACGYDLTGMSGEKCPECGFSVNATRRDIYKLINKRHLAACFLLCVPMVWVVWMGVTFFSWAILLNYRVSQLQAIQDSGATATLRWPYIYPSKPRWPDDVEPRLWVSWQVCRVWIAGKEDALDVAASLTDYKNVTLKPWDPNLPRGLQWWMFFTHWVLWPGDHYRRYVPVYPEPVAWVEISGATSADDKLFELLTKIGPVSHVAIINSQIDGETLEALSGLTMLTQLDIQAVNAPVPELMQLKSLQELEIFSIDFGRPIGEADIQLIDGLPKLTTLALTAQRAQAGSDEALAKLISKPRLWRIKLNMELKEREFPKTLKVMRERFDHSFTATVPEDR